MGQKVNPIGYRLGVNKTWQSKWYSKDNYQEYLINDIKIREYLEKKLKDAGISKIEIERNPKSENIARCTNLLFVILNKPFIKNKNVIIVMNNCGTNHKGQLKSIWWPFKNGVRRRFLIVSCSPHHLPVKWKISHVTIT